MPAFDFKCPEGHVTEHFLSVLTERVPCSEMVWNDDQQDMYQCGQIAEYYPTFYYNSPAQRFDPVVIHRAADGTIRYPGHTNAQVPEGFQRVELTDVNQVRALERDVERQQGEVAAGWQATKQRFLDGQLACNREAVDAIARGGAWQGLDEEGRVITRHGLTPQGLRFLERMREASRDKQARGASAASPAFYLEAFANNSSNREEYNDPRGEFGARKGRK